MTRGLRKSARATLLIGVFVLASGCHHVYRIGPYPCGSEKLKVAFNWETSSFMSEGPDLVSTTVVLNVGSARAKSGLVSPIQGIDETGRHRDSTQENFTIRLAPPPEIKPGGIVATGYALLARNEVEATRFRNCIDEYHSKILNDSVASAQKEEVLSPWYIAEISFPKAPQGNPDVPTKIDFAMLAKPETRARLSRHYVRISGKLGDAGAAAIPNYASVILSDEKNARRVSLWFPHRGEFPCRAGQHTTFTGIYLANDDPSFFGEVSSETPVKLECK